MTSRERPRTIALLIAELSIYPQDMRVMVRGYEGGYSDCPAPITKRVDLNVNAEWYYGPHEDSGYEGYGLEVVVL